MRVADFFCGAGGFSEGFRQAGFEIVFAVDKWEPAIMTYKGNKPDVNVICDDVIRISKLNDEDFEKLIPDSDVIIGSPPCQAFSGSNKSGNGDKTLGIELLEAYLRIVARKKYKKNSKLKYWILENVPNVKHYIKDRYTANDLGLEGDFILSPHSESSGIYNAKYYGAPTNRNRYLCGDFPVPEKVRTEETALKLRDVIDCLGNPFEAKEKVVKDINYPDLAMLKKEITDYEYVYRLAPFEWKTAKRLKQDKGYMGRMSFPENLDKPSRTVMATMSTSSREAMVLKNGSSGYRLPTVREAACMMSFPMDYRFYGKTKATKHTLVGNAVPPKMSYAIAKAIAFDSNEEVPNFYPRITHDDKLEFINLNGNKYPLKRENAKKINSKFKYHIPYLILSSYRVELTNYHSDFEKVKFKWDAEIHYSQGKRAKILKPHISIEDIGDIYMNKVTEFIGILSTRILDYNDFQYRYCLTTNQRKANNLMGPFELLDEVKKFVSQVISNKECERLVSLVGCDKQLPFAIVVGFYIIGSITSHMSVVKCTEYNLKDFERKIKA
jgi:DNA (cytosine-5)-methyltransferase 1